MNRRSAVFVRLPHSHLFSRVLFFYGLRDVEKKRENKDDIFAKCEASEPFSGSEIAKIKPCEIRICRFREIRYARKLVRII